MLKSDLSSSLNQPKTETPARPPDFDPVAIGMRVEGIAPWRRRLSERIIAWVVGSLRFGAIRFFWLLNGLNLLLFSLAFLAPLLAWQGWTWFYQKVFQACHLLCVQNHEHSFSLFGYQMPLCERCLALYGSMFFGGVAYQLARVHPQAWFAFKLKRLPLWGVVLTSLPIAIDGFTQMFGWRESNWGLRLFTGALFGLGFIWYLYPQLSDKLNLLKKVVSR
jgi:uncharacterized membrane protein